MLTRAPTQVVHDYHSDSLAWDRYRPRPGDIVIGTAAKVGTTWTQQIVNLAGVAACGPNAPNVASMNTGPHLGAMMTMSYLIEQKGVKNLCYSALNIDVATVFRDVYLPVWEQVTGHKVHALIFSEPGADLTPAVVQARDAGCDGVMLVYTKPDYIRYAELAQSQGMLGGAVSYAMLTSGYSENVRTKLGDAGQGWVTNSEFAPYTDDPANDGPDLADWRSLLEPAGLEPTSFAQGGYLSAKIAVEALKTITNDDYSKESVGKALQAVSYTSDMLGEPFKFVAFAGGAQSNVASKMVQIDGDGWKTITDWVYWPPADGDNDNVTTKASGV